MKDIVFDIEADGLLDTATKIHCIVVQPADGSSGPHEVPIEDFMEANYSHLIGHNIMGYDLPLLEKLYGWKTEAKVIDTLLLSRLIYTDLYDLDLKSKRIKLGGFGGHNLASWGQRFGLQKLDYKDFETYCPEMLEYCKRDVEITTKLYQLLKSKNYSQEAIRLEHEFAEIIHRQIRRGFAFDVEKAKKLYLYFKDESKVLEMELKDAFGGWWKSLGEFTPKRKNRTRGYTEGGTFTKLEWVDFNPGSREQIVEGLKRKYGWTPQVYTDNGNPKMDETVIDSLEIPEDPELKNRLQRYLMLNKRMSSIGDGKSAWLKLEKNGRLHGNVQTNGAVTGRCTHSNPNLANVTASYSEYGRECRELFKATDGYYLVGCDASGLELRALAHYLFQYDNGKFARAVVEGDKEEGTDPHSLNAKMLGDIERDTAKTWIYAFIYGAGEAKLARILGVSTNVGAKLKAMFLEKFPALSKLLGAIEDYYDEHGRLVGLDGRKLYIRSRHKLLNTLIQGAGALIMKQSLVICDHKLRNHYGLVPIELGGNDYEFVVNVHDEWQVECYNYPVADLVGKVSKLSIEDAGRYFDFKCPVTGDFKIGKTWAETH